MTLRQKIQTCDHATVAENIRRQITGIRAMRHETPGDPEEFKAPARVIDARRSFHPFHNPNVAPDGMIAHRGGNLIRYRGVSTDVAERNRAELALRKSEELNRTIFEQAAVGFAQVGPEGHFLRVNDKLCAILGYSRDELMRLTFQEITYPGDLDTDMDFLRQLQRGEINTYSMEKRYICKNRTLVWANLTVSLVRGEGAEYFISLVEDITRRKQAEIELHELSGRLIDAQEKERAWLAKELHDGLSQELALLAIKLDQLGIDPPKTSSQVSVRIEELSKRVKELAVDVHHLSHGLHPSILESLGLVVALKSFCRELECAKNLVIHFAARDVPENLPKELALCLYRVTQEALQNVSKHSGAKQATVEIDVVENEIHLRIVDDGKGFDLRSKATTASLGLVGMRERIGLLRGEIRWETSPGRGTTVRARVPIPDNIGPSTNCFHRSSSRPVQIVARGHENRPVTTDSCTVQPRP